MPLITIITPTYNRRNLLDQLFDSLLKQTNYGFEWLIVDDGSDDGTDLIVEKYKKQDAFIVQYIKKQNGGKHTALNVGIKLINTELTMIVDSDDQLLPDAIAVIYQYYAKYHCRDIGCYSFLKGDVTGIPLIKLPKDEYIDSYIKCRIRENRLGDMAEVFVTEVLKKFPFPEYEGEKFLSEDINWIKIGKEYKFLFVNKIIYRCNYLENGLSANDKLLKFNSPVGSMMRGKMLMSKECGFKTNIKGAIIYNCYSLGCNKKDCKVVKIDSLFSRVLVFITKPLGLYFYKKWRK